MRLMMNRYQRDGVTAATGADARPQAMLGRPMRSYRDFAREMAERWLGE